MKKLISLVLALVLCVAAMPVMAFADTTSTDGLFGVIVDADGNIVERIPMSRATYVNSIYTIQPNHTFISYQYEPVESFLIGYSTRDTHGNYITTSDARVALTIEGSMEIGGDNKTPLMDKRITIDHYLQDMGDYLSVYVESVGYKYYNGKLTNQSSAPVTVRIIVATDFNEDDWEIFGEW